MAMGAAGMEVDKYVEPEEALSSDDEAELQRQEEAYINTYENDHTWDQLQEDEFGNLYVDKTAEQRAKRTRLMSAAQSARIRKGMIRYLLLVIDLSRAASQQDMRPNRLTVMLSVARSFVRDFFDQNPLSQLGIAVMRAGVVERVTELSGTPEAQVARLEPTKLGAAGGDASLQNALDLGIATLHAIPPYGHREMLVLFAGLSTCDPGNIRDSIRDAKDANIRVSIVGVAAEVYVCRRITEETGGQYAVALNEQHLEGLMLEHSPPPPTSSARAASELVRMGFPQRSTEDSNAAVFVGVDARIMAGSYTCPRCKARVVELPCECHTCGLTLISSPHLARSYHHLFPVTPYDEVSQEEAAALRARSASGGGAGASGRGTGSGVGKSSSSGFMALLGDDEEEEEEDGSAAAGGSGLGGGGRGGGGRGVKVQAMHGEVATPLYCFGCLRDLSGAGAVGAAAAGDGAGGSRGGGRGGGAEVGRGGSGGMVLRCPGCTQHFCFECDIYVHENLHNCPGCEFPSGGPGSGG